MIDYSTKSLIMIETNGVNHVSVPSESFKLWCKTDKIKLKIRPSHSIMYLLTSCQQFINWDMKTEAKKKKKKDDQNIPNSLI